MSDLVVGIDLGTTNSAAAYFHNDKLQMLENDSGGYTTPSYVFFLSSETTCVGKLAKSRGALKPEHGIYEIKRFIGRQYYEVESQLNYLPFTIENVSGDPRVYLEKYHAYKSPQEISAYILQHIKKHISEKLGKHVDKAVITVPAHFNVSQRKATLEAAKIAGFTVLKLFNEPSAAALNYFYENKDIPQYQKYFMVYDLGGGTFDVAILERTGEDINIVCTDGDSYLGGNDFDNLITDYVCKEIKTKYRITQLLDRRSIRRIKNYCVSAKETLSSVESAPIILEGFFGKDIIEIPLTRQQFEEMCQKLFERSIEIVDRCIKSAGLYKTDISEVILAGGSTRIPKVRQLLTDYFNKKEINKCLHPDECIAKGAALQAAMLSQNPSQKIKHFNISEVTSSSLGIEDVSHKMDFIIKKNTPIPASKSVTHATIFENQKTIALKIYEGESIDARKNICLGVFKITDLTPAPPGMCKVKVTMSIDTNGILTVTATEKFGKSVNNLEIAYSKVNRVNASTVRKTNEKTDNKEDARFMEFAKIHEFLIKYCAAITYNFSKNKISTCVDILSKCTQIKHKIVSMENSANDVETIKQLGTELIKICQPLVKKYNFENMPNNSDVGFTLTCKNYDHIWKAKLEKEDSVNTRSVVDDPELKNK